MTWYSSRALRKTWDRIKNSRGRDGRRNPSVGLDGVTAEKFDAQLKQNIAEIQRLLSRADSNDPDFPAYRFAPFRSKTISREPGKLRQIHIPRIRDQVVLRAISDEITRVVSKSYPDFLKTSPRNAVKQVIHGRESGKLQVLRADVNKYYPSIPHPLMLKTLADFQVDPRVIRMTQRALTVPLRDTRLGKGADKKNTLGTPTGTSLSTVLGECYLLDLESSLKLKNINLSLKFNKLPIIFLPILVKVVVETLIGILIDFLEDFDNVIFSRLTGSGSCIYSVFEKKEHAVNAQNKFQQSFSNLWTRLSENNLVKLF